MCEAAAGGRDPGELRGQRRGQRRLRGRRGGGPQRREEEESVRRVQEEGGADRVHVQVQRPLLLHTQIQRQARMQVRLQGETCTILVMNFFSNNDVKRLMISSYLLFNTLLF